MAISNHQIRTRKRTVRRLAEKNNRRIQNAITNDLLDSVLTNLSYQDKSGTTDFITSTSVEEQSDSRAANDSHRTKLSNLPLQKLHASLFPSDLAQRIQIILDQYSGKCSENTAKCKQVASLLNQVVNGAKLTLNFTPTGEPVRLRIVCPARSGKAYFQLRTANAKQQAVYTGIKFPALSVF